MPLDFDRLLEELADLNAALDVDLSDFPMLAQYSSLPSARNLVFEATDAVARAQARGAEDPRLEARALEAVQIARTAARKARVIASLVRLRDKLR